MKKTLRNGVSHSLSLLASSRPKLAVALLAVGLSSFTFMQPAYAQLDPTAAWSRSSAPERQGCGVQGNAPSGGASSAS